MSSACEWVKAATWVRLKYHLWDGLICILVYFNGFCSNGGFDLQITGSEITVTLSGGFFSAFFLQSFLHFYYFTTANFVLCWLNCWNKLNDTVPWIWDDAAKESQKPFCTVLTEHSHVGTYTQSVCNDAAISGDEYQICCCQMCSVAEPGWDSRSPHIRLHWARANVGEFTVSTFLNQFMSNSTWAVHISRGLMHVFLSESTRQVVRTRRVLRDVITNDSTN